MTAQRNTILILEDTPDRISRFKCVLTSELPNIQYEIVNTAAEMFELIRSQLPESFAVSLDHDLYVSGINDPGDGLQVAEHLSSLSPSCPVIIHTSNAEKSRQMQGILEANRWAVRLAGAIGTDWIEVDWIAEVKMAYKSQIA